MTTSLIPGVRSWGGERDDEGYRTWTLSRLVESDDPANDGPATVMQTTGLSIPGAQWNFGNDSDSWAFCLPYMRVSKAPELKDGDPVNIWVVEQRFTTKPMKRCNTTTIENPLDEPAKISGSFVKYTEEGAFDKDGNLIKSSSHERFQGQQVEFDNNRPTVRISMNLSSLGLSTYAVMVDTLNDSTLWGLPARCVKLSNVSWERQLYGTCTYYFTVTYEFDVNYSTFDRQILDEGNKVLNGHWDQSTGDWTLDDINGSAPDPNNPKHFIRAIDRAGNPMRALLNGAGLPVDVGETGTGSNSLYAFLIQYYRESNFLSLGIPSSLG